MSIHKDDRFLWFLVGVGLFVAYRGIIEQLHHVRTLTEITHDESPGRRLDQETEDTVSLETLAALTKSHSFELRNASIRIICERFANGQAIKQLYHDISGDDPRKRDDALTTALFLLNSSAVSEAKKLQYFFYSFEFLKALTTCLVKLLPEHKKPKSSKADEPMKSTTRAKNSPIRPPNRPLAETKALRILCKVIDDVKYTALVAGIVSDWLAHYPFPCALEENGSHRDMVLNFFQSWYDDDPLMNNILGVFCTFSEGRHALCKAGYPIWGEGSVGEDGAGSDDLSFSGDLDGDVVMHGAEDTAGGRLQFSFLGPRRPSRRRARPPDSAEEQAVRRRRREAMVLSDGGGPLGQDNIIQREEGGATPPVPTTTDVEEELTRLQEEVDREFEEEESVEGEVGALLDDQQMAEILR
ncbi:hypothetical protein UCRPC4_g00521 [Phaeomoniella chlamydospora]|uniref:Cytoskeleton-associated protein n=1 Tax=Phaeomoniella chlamydospora TaxID=158046 RepID=A0A0G2GZI4_PHACM|nr:hypothetical protein UCRPC4_g00521 [Phaeomoniella chlamydospora]